MKNSWENSLGRKPDFFKVLIGDFEQRLQIPQAFVKQISQESSEIAIIEGPSGNCWHVKLNKTTNDIYLQDGWEEFSKAHSLRVGEFLVFRHCGNMHFRVKIFDKSACEREDAFMVKCSQDLDNCQGNKRQRQRQSKSSLEPSHLSHHSNKCKMDYILEQKHPHQSDLSDLPQGKRGSLPKPGRIMVTKTEAKEAAYSFTSLEAEEAAYSFTSSFPYFVTQMKAYSLGPPFHLTIPVHFSRLHLPSVSTTVALRNQEGNMWMVDFRVYPKQCWLHGGWNVFLCANNLKYGDYCVFELVDELEMQVHIFRLSSQKSSCSVRVKEETHKPSTGKGWRVYETRKRAISPPPSRPSS